MAYYTLINRDGSISRPAVMRLANCFAKRDGKRDGLKNAWHHAKAQSRGFLTNVWEPIEWARERGGSPTITLRTAQVQQ